MRKRYSRRENLGTSFVILASLAILTSGHSALAESALSPGGGELIACDVTGSSAAFACDGNGCESFLPIFLATGGCTEPEADTEPLPAGSYEVDSWGRSKLEEIAEAKAPDEWVEFHARLPEVDFEFSQLAVPGADRTLLIEQRKASLEAIQNYAEDIVLAYGGVVLNRTWLVNGVVVVAPAQTIPDFVAEPYFVELSPALPSFPTATNGWSGLEFTDGTLSEELFNGGYDGETGGRTSSPNDNI